MLNRHLLITAALVVLAGNSLPAQAEAPDPETEVAAVVQRLFDGMRSGDGEMVRSVFHPAARLQTAAARDGAPVLQEGDVDDFVRAVGTPREQVWDERIWDLEVRVDGNLATAWMRYAFYVDDRFSHCGVNAMQLFRDGEGWRIVQLIDTRRREGCPSPPVADGARSRFG
jgi:hypothetical protein